MGHLSGSCTSCAVAVAEAVGVSFQLEGIVAEDRWFLNEKILC